MLVSAREMLARAAQDHYAIGQFNINNLEWIKAALLAAQEMRSPIILGVTAAACKYMGGLRTVRAMTEGMIQHLNVTVPVALHLDHSSEDFCLEAIGAGFSSVMFDGSKMPFEENLRICVRLAAICHDNNVSLEAELGSPAGEEEDISGTGDKALPSQCAALAQSGITCLAAAIGNMHGEYPPAWPGLDMKLLQEIRAAVNGLPLVLHGGSGVPDEQISRAIKLGIAKINVNTECQMAFASAIKEYFASGQDAAPKGYAIARLMGAGTEAIKNKIREKILFFGSANKS